MSSPRKSTTMGVENISKSDQMSSPISSCKPPPKWSSPAPGASPTVRRALPRRSEQVGPRPTTPLDAKISPLAKSTPLETKTSFSAAKSGSSDAKTTVSGTTTISYARSTSAETKTAQLTRPVSSEDKSRLQTNTNLDGKISPRARSPLPQTKRASVASKSTEIKTTNLVAKTSQRAKSPLPENKITKTTFKSTGATSLNSDVTTSERTQSPHPQTKIATAISKTAEAKPTNLEIKTLQRAKSPLPDTKIATATSKSTPPAKPPRRSLKNVNSINSANGDTRKRLSEADVELRSKSPATAEMSSPETPTQSSRKSAVPIRRPHSELVASSDDLRVDTSNSKSTKVQHMIRQFNSFNSFRNARDVARERAQRLADLRPKTPTDKGLDRNSRSGTPSDIRVQRTSRPVTPTDKNSVDKRRTSTPADIGVGTGTPTEKNSVDRRRTSTPADIGTDRTSRPKTPADKIVDRTSRPGTPTDKSLKRTSNPIQKQRTSDIPVSQSPVPFNKSSNESVTSTSEKSSSKSIRNSGKSDTSQDDLTSLNFERAEKLSANRSLPSLPVSASSKSKEETKTVDKILQEKNRERSIPTTSPRKLPQSTIVSINSRTSQVQSPSNPVQSRSNTARSPTPTDKFKLTTPAPFKRAQSPLLKTSQGKVTQVKLSESVTKKTSPSDTDKASDSSSETNSVEHDDSLQNTNIGQSKEMNLKSDKSTSENTDPISEENFEYDTSVKSANINPAKSPYFRRKILPIKKGPEVVTKPNTNPKFPFSKSPVPHRFLSRNTSSKTNIRNTPDKSVDTSSSFSENLPTNNGSKDNAKADPSEKFAMVEGSLEDGLSVISAVESSVDPPREPDDIIWDNCEISTSEILITDTNQNIVKDYVKERIPASNQCETDNGIENKKSSDRSNMLDHAMEDKYMANQNNVKDVTMKIASSIVGHHSDTEGPKSANQNSEDIQEWKKNSVNANANRVTENPPNLNSHEGTSESVDDNALDVESVNKANKNVANDNTDEIDDHEVQNITHKDQTTTDTRKNLLSGSININAVDNDLSVNEPDIEEDLTVKSAMRYPVGNCRENKTKGLNPSLTKNALQNKLSVLDADQSKAEKENKSDFLNDTSSSDTHREPSVDKSSIRNSSEKQNKASAVNETETNVNNNNDLSIEEDLSVISVSISEEDVNKARRKLYHKNVPLNSPRPVSRKLSENKFLRMDKMQGNLSFKKEEEASKSQAAGKKFSISESSDGDSKFNNSFSTLKGGSSGDDSAIESTAGLESPSRPAITKLQTDTFSKVPKPSVEQKSDSKLNIKDSTQNIHHQSTTSNAKDRQNFREKLLRGSADGEESGIIDDSVFCEDENENSAVWTSANSKKGDALRSIPHLVNKKDSETSQTDFNTHVMQHSSPKLMDKMEGQESSGKDTYNENHSQHSFPKRPDTLYKHFKQQNVLQSSIGSLPYQSYHESSSPKSESIDTKVSKVTSGQMNHSASTIHGKEFSKGMASRYFDIRNANMTQEPSRFVFRSTTEATVSSSSDFVDTEAKDSGYCDVKEVSLEYRKASDRINTALVTLRSELKAMREQDLVLLRQLITISETIQRLSGTRKLRLSKSLSLSYGGLQPRSIRGQSTSSLERQNSAPHMEEMKRQLFSSTRHLGSAEADSMSSIGEYEFDSTSDLDETCFSSTSTLSLFHQFSPASPEPRPHSTHGHHIADVTISLESLDGSGGSYEEILRRNVRLWKLSVQTHKPVIEEVTCLL